MRVTRVRLALDIRTEDALGDQQRDALVQAVCVAVEQAVTEFTEDQSNPLVDPDLPATWLTYEADRL